MKSLLLAAIVATSWGNASYTPPSLVRDTANEWDLITSTFTIQANVSVSVLIEVWPDGNAAAVSDHHQVVTGGTTWAKSLSFFFEDPDWSVDKDYWISILVTEIGTGQIVHDEMIQYTEWQ